MNINWNEIAVKATRLASAGMGEDNEINVNEEEFGILEENTIQYIKRQLKVCSRCVRNNKWKL